MLTHIYVHAQATRATSVSITSDCSRYILYWICKFPQGTINRPVVEERKVQ